MPLQSKLAELPTPHTDLAHCRQTLSGGSRSFWVASQLLPPTLRNDACGLYAFCREADDLIDEGDDADAALVQLHRRLDGIYSGAPQKRTVDRVLQRIVTQHQLPRTLLEALLEGFAWDASGREYHTLSDVFAYGARVAGVVGVMMAVLMGVREPKALARAADLGVAMQLTNIARDVGEDARAGRLYLPRQLLKDAGIDADAFLQSPAFSPELCSVIERLLIEAEKLYKRSESGIALLPVGARPGIYAARLLYAEIGHALLKCGGNSVDKRAYIGMAGKARLILSTPKWVTLNKAGLNESALPECQYLLDAVKHAQTEQSAELHHNSFFRRIYRRMVWTLDLFAALEARQQATTAGHGSALREGHS
jgi:phytoene synthase